MHSNVVEPVKLTTQLGGESDEKGWTIHWNRSAGLTGRLMLHQTSFMYYTSIPVMA
jgi:hypothetical protein